MSTPDRDDLERRLAELFQQRAATVTRVRQFETGTAESHRKPVRLVPGRNHPRWQKVGVLVAAAVVFLAVAGTVLGIQAHKPRSAPPLGRPSVAPTSPTPTPTPSSTATRTAACQVPASWRQAITDGAVPVDRALNAVVSANGATGDYLAIQGNQPPTQSSQIYSDLELALFHGSKGVNIFTPAHSTDFLQADPTGAISPDWVAFAVARPQSLNYSYQVMLYQRSTRTVRTLVDVPDKQYAQGKAVLGAPVIAAGRVYWLTAVYNKPETTTLDSWDLARGSAAGSVAAPGATGLVGYGSGVALLHQSVSGTVETDPGLSNGAGAPLPKAQLDATAGGSNFGFDGTSKLSWLRYNGKLVRYASLIVGGTGVSYGPWTAQSPGIRPAVFPFTDVSLPDDADALNPTTAVLDLRTNTAVTLPAGVSLEAVVGDSVVFGTGTSKAGAAGLSIVALSALAPAHC